MSSFVASLESQNVWAVPVAKPLDEAAWQAWSARGRAHDQRSSTVRISAVMWASIAALLCAAVFWSDLVPFEVAVRFLVTAGSMVVLFQALQAKYYGVAVAFGALAVFYNPAVPIFSFSNDWQRAVVAASAVPFVLSLPWRDKRAKNND